jgi:hypothetical protein
MEGQQNERASAIDSNVPLIQSSDVGFHHVDASGHVGGSHEWVEQKPNKDVCHLDH